MLVVHKTMFNTCVNNIEVDSSSGRWGLLGYIKDKLVVVIKASIAVKGEERAGWRVGIS